MSRLSLPTFLLPSLLPFFFFLPSLLPRLPFFSLSSPFPHLFSSLSPPTCLLPLPPSFLSLPLHIRLCYVNSLAGHEGPVSVIATSPTLGDIATVCTCKTPKQSSKPAAFSSSPFLWLHTFTHVCMPCKKAILKDYVCSSASESVLTELCVLASHTCIQSHPVLCSPLGLFPGSSMLNVHFSLVSWASDIVALTIYAHAHTHAHTHTCTHTRTHTCTHTHMHAHMHTHTHMHAHTHARTHTCTHTHTHARTHTRTRTHTPQSMPAYCMCGLLMGRRWDVYQWRCRSTVSLIPLPQKGSA